DSLAPVLPCADRRRRFFEREKRGLCPLVERPSGRGGRHAACASFEQRDAHARLESCDRLRKRRLSDVKPVRRLCDLALVDRGNEVAEQPWIEKRTHGTLWLTQAASRSRLPVFGRGEPDRSVCFLPGYHGRSEPMSGRRRRGKRLRPA